MGVTDRIPSSQRLVAPRFYLARLLEMAPVGIATVDKEGRVLECNDQTLKILGVIADELVGQALADSFDDPEALSRFIAESFGSQTPETATTLSRTIDDRTRHLEIRAATLATEEMDEFALVILLDVTDRVAREESSKQILHQIGFLAEASRRLASSLQVDEILATLAHVAVPAIADWCAVDLLEREGDPTRVVVRHRDESKNDLAEALKEYAPVPSAPTYRALAAGQPVVIHAVDDRILDELTHDAEHKRLVIALGATSAIVVPLEARGRRLGAILLVRSEGAGPYEATDLAVAQDLAQRAALAMDNARLFQEHRHVARKLQESLLPPSLPVIPGIEVGARYVAAGEGVEVGGDFYDFFRLAGRGWGVVIGDVSGKGPDAAGVTALARYTARAAAMQVRSVRRIFKILNEAILQETGAERFVSVAFVRVDASAQPGSKKVVVASAGHPPPLVLRAETAAVDEIGEPGTILGLLEDVNVKDQTIQLHPGDLLVLYTDGVTEARSDQGRLLGMAGVRRLVATCAGLTAAQAAERLAEVVLEYQGQRPRDDLAIVTLRVAPEGITAG